jgi:hypothetical protein
MVPSFFSSTAHHLYRNLISISNISHYWSESPISEKGEIFSPTSQLGVGNILWKKTNP